MSEAELIQAMHEQRASVDLEYTPITAPLPELVRPAEVAALREEVRRLGEMWNEEHTAAVRLDERLRAARRECGALHERVAELERQLDAVPVEAILRYLDHMWACSYPGSMRDMKAMAAWADGERAKQQEAQP